MTTRLAMSLASAAVLSGAVSLISSTTVHALTAKECSAKYQDAKKTGTLGGKSWNDFRKTQCTAGGAPAAPAATPAPRPAPASFPKPASSATTRNAVFPKAIAQRYSSESPGKARMHTCLTQYKANKASNANGGLQWIQKGGGYYSECDKHLRGG